MTRKQHASRTPVGERDEWRTPRFVFDYFNRIFSFEVDLAATEDNKLCAYHYCRESDTLAASWAGLGISRGWCNPPYSNIDPWLEKARIEALQGFTTALLIPAPNGEERYGRYVFGVASEIWFINGRLAFLRPDGTPAPGNTRGSVLVVYRGYNLRNTRMLEVNRDYMEART